MKTDKPSIKHIPAIGICGWSGSGKTTLILALIAHFCAKGLRVGVIKHDVHGLQLDREGKDSYRFFESGADVVMRSQSELLVRAHRAGPMELEDVLREVAPYFDLILVEGHKTTPLIDKVWVLAENETACTSDVPNVIDVLQRDEHRSHRATALIEQWLAVRWKQTPVWAAVILSNDYPGSVIERRKGLSSLGDALVAVTSDVIAVGPTDFGLPLVFAGSLSPAPDHSGWLSHVLAAMRWLPTVSWLFVSEGVDAEQLRAATGLLEKRSPGVWRITLPNAFQAGQNVQALYCDFRARPLFEGHVEMNDMEQWSMLRQE